MRLTRLAAPLAAASILAAAGCGAPPEPGLPLRRLPTVSQNEPGPGDPPVVWVGGTLEEVEEGNLALREGSAGGGPRIRLERLAGGATSFYRLEGEAWRELPLDEVDSLEVGERACIEALLDGQTFLALRVFLDSACGPTGPPG